MDILVSEHLNKCALGVSPCSGDDVSIILTEARLCCVL